MTLSRSCVSHRTDSKRKGLPLPGAQRLPENVKDRGDAKKAGGDIHINLHGHSGAFPHGKALPGPRRRSPLGLRESAPSNGFNPAFTAASVYQRDLQ